MELASRIIASLSSRARRLTRLAKIGGDNERLAKSLAQHATRGAPPRIKEGLQALAAAETADAVVIRELLLARGSWPARLLAPVADGSSNWARLNADLAASVELVRALDAAIAEWEGPDPPLAERLRGLSAAKQRRLPLLRDLATKCDPQAID